MLRISYKYLLVSCLVQMFFYSSAYAGFYVVPAARSGYVDTSSANATATDIRTGTTAWVDGVEVVGELYKGVTCTSPAFIFNSADDPDATDGTGTRWCDNLDGTVTDLYSGLVWLKNANCWGDKKLIDTVTWDDAQVAVGTLYDQVGTDNDCGLADGSVEGDWRLPTLSELKFLMTDPQRVRLATPRAFGLSVSNKYYWTSTSITGVPQSAYILYPFNGNVSGTGDFSLKNVNSYHVWAVRESQ